MESGKSWQKEHERFADFQAVCDYSEDCSVTAITIGTGTREENVQFNTLEQIVAGDALNSTGNVSSVYLTFAVLNTNTETDSLTTENASVGGVEVDGRRGQRRQPP